MDGISTRPVILKEGRYNSDELNKLKDGKAWHIRDIYKLQLEELYEIEHPELLGTPDFEEKRMSSVERIIEEGHGLAGDWIYYPWSGELIHTLPLEKVLLLRLNRNRNLITPEEQQSLLQACVGIAGLSVGSHIATNLAYNGVAGKLKLAEFDSLETSNLNRIRARLQDVGLSKLEITCQQLYELDPTLSIQIYPKGLTRDSVEEFVFMNPRPRVIFEIIDDFEMKLILRQAAKKAGIPVVVGANLGDSILFDIERYDLEPDLPIFNGLLGDLPEKILEMPDADKNNYAVQMVGRENVPHRAMESVAEIGKSLAGRPQLSGTVAINGAVSTFIARKIILGQSLESGRYKLSLPSIFNIAE